MKNKCLKNIFLDNIFVFFIFILNTVCIFLYYYSSSETPIDLLYPLLMSLFFCGIYVLFLWYKNFDFLRKLNHCIDNEHFKLAPKNRFQKSVAKTIDSMNSSYAENISSMENDIELYDNFITQWIHNLKTPATVQSLILSQIEDNSISKEDLISLKHENKFILDNLQNLLNLIRVKEFSKDYIPTSCNITKSINKLINTNKNLFIYNKVFPKFESPKEPIFILTDEKWNNFILQQLISNAVKYSALRDETKYIHLRLSLTDKNKVTLEIEDEGIGIPKYDLERIFDPFFTGENGRHHKSSTGIGLYLASFISKKLNHSLSVRSEVNKGTTMILQYHQTPNERLM